jgi:hypothetical protein
MSVIKDESNEHFRMYTIMPPDSTILNPDGGEIDMEHPDAVIVRIGQYATQKPEKGFTPPPYFIEVELNDSEKLDTFKNALDYSVKNDHFQKCNVASGNKGTPPYTIEFVMHERSRSADMAQQFNLDLMDKLARSLISVADAKEILANEKKFALPSARDIAEIR